jgi:hypothetical protein
MSSVSSSSFQPLALLPSCCLPLLLLLLLMDSDFSTFIMCEVRCVALAALAVAAVMFEGGMIRLLITCALCCKA